MGVVKIREKEATRPAPPVKAPISRGTVGRASLAKGKILIRLINIDLVPRRYLMLDESKIRFAIKSGIKEIKGVEVKQEMALRVS